ncbi:hypothetical protein HDU85_004070 [Gaertneriomyces sp. JEL0708]|nr:hypothetical protein HDU85_004070 [Gaertneriomyces sp. JEL0708]
MTGPRLFMWKRPKDGAPPPQEKTAEHLVVDPPPPDTTTTNDNNNNNTDNDKDNNNDHPVQVEESNQVPDNHTLLSRSTSTTSSTFSKKSKLRLSLDTSHTTLSTISDPWHYDATPDHPMPVSPDTVPEAHPWYKEASVSKPIRFPLVRPSHNDNCNEDDDTPQVWWTEASAARPQIVSPTSPLNVLDEQEYPWYIRATPHRPFKIRSKSKSVGTPEAHHNNEEEEEEEDDDDRTVVSASRSEPAPVRVSAPRSMHVCGVVVRDTLGHDTDIIPSTAIDVQCVIPIARGVEETVNDTAAETVACTSTEQDLRCVIPVVSGVREVVMYSVVGAEIAACTATEQDVQCVIPIASGVQETVMDSVVVAETAACNATEQDVQCVIPIASGVQETMKDTAEETFVCTATEQDVQCVIPIARGVQEVVNDTAGHGAEIACAATDLECVVPIANGVQEVVKDANGHGAAIIASTAAEQDVQCVIPIASGGQEIVMDSVAVAETFASTTTEQDVQCMIPIVSGTVTHDTQPSREANHSTIDFLFPITMGTSTLTHLAPCAAEPLSLHPPVSLRPIEPTALGTLHNLEESALISTTASLSPCETDLTYIFPFLQGIQCHAQTPIATAQAVPITSSTLQRFAPFVPLLSPISEISDIHETGTCTTLEGSPMWTEHTDGSDAGDMVGNTEEEELRRRVLEGLDGIQWVRSEKRVERLTKPQSGMAGHEDVAMDVIEWYREKADDQHGIMQLSSVREDDARSFHVSIASPPSTPHGEGSENRVVSVPSSSETTEACAALDENASHSPEMPSSSEHKRLRPSFSSARSDMAVVDGHFSGASQNRPTHTLVARSAEDHHHHSVPVQSTTTTTTQLNAVPEDAVHLPHDSVHPMPPTFTPLMGPVRRPWLARSVTRDTVASSCFTSDMSATGDASAVDSGVGDLSVVNDDGAVVMGKGKDFLPYDVQGSLTTFLAMDKGVRAVEVYRVECLTPGGGGVGVAETIYGGAKAMDNKLVAMNEPVKEEKYDEGGRMRSMMMAPRISGTGGDTLSVDPPLGMAVEEVEAPFEGEDRERVSIAGMTSIVLAQLAYLLLVLSATGHRGVIGIVIGMGSACLWTWVGSWNRHTRDKLLMGCLVWMMAWCAAGAGVGPGEVGDAIVGVAGVGGAGGWVLGATMISHGGKKKGKWTRRVMNVLGGWVLVFAPVLGGLVAVVPDRERWVGAGVTCAMVLSALLWVLEMWRKPRTRSQSPSEVSATYHSDIPKLGFWPVLLLSFGSAAFIGGLSFGGLPASPFTYLPCFSNINTTPIPLSWTIIRTLFTVGSAFLLLGLAFYIRTHSVSTVLPKLLIPISTALTISSITLLLHFPTLAILSLPCESWDWTLVIPLLGVLLSPLFDMHHTQYATKTIMTTARLVVLVAGATVLLVSSPTTITTASAVGPLIGLFCVAICVRVATGPKRDAGTGGVTVVSGILLGTALARCVVGVYTSLHRNNNNNNNNNGGGFRNEDGDGEILVIIPQALRVLHGVGLGLAGLAAGVYLLSHFTNRIRKQHPPPSNA